MFPEVSRRVGSTCFPVLSEFGVPAICSRFTQRVDRKDRTQQDQDGEITGKNLADLEVKSPRCACAQPKLYIKSGRAFDIENQERSRSGCQLCRAWGFANLH